MQEERLLKYVDAKSKDYTRAFANTTLMTISPYQDVVIDFCEESMEPFLIVQRKIDGDTSDIVYSQDPNDIVVRREMKFSITMNKEQALRMAEWIYNNCVDDSDRGKIE